MLTRPALVTTLLLCIGEVHRSNIGPDTDCPAPACDFPQSLYQNAGSIFEMDHNQPSSPFWSVTIKQSSETLQWITASLNKLPINTRVHIFDTSRRASSHFHLRKQMDSISANLLSIPIPYNISNQYHKYHHMYPHTASCPESRLFNIHYHNNLKMFMMNTDWQC